MATLQTTKNRINKSLNARVSTMYHNEIPMDVIFQVIRANGGLAVDEEGNEWSGILCGSEERMVVPVVFPEMKSIYLYISWYKMPSGRYEVTAYVS